MADRNILKEAWFWLFLIGVLVFFVFLIFYEYYRKQSNTPVWVYVLAGVAPLIIVVGLVLYGLHPIPPGKLIVEVIEEPVAESVI